MNQIWLGNFIMPPASDSAASSPGDFSQAMLQLTRMCNMMSRQYGADIYIGLRQNHWHHDRRPTEEVATQEADTSSPPSIPTNVRIASSEIYKGCKYPSHQDIYSEWPTQDAELTIV
jgi:hypothetical protein